MFAGPLPKASFVESTRTAGADSVCLDLQDMVPPDEKAAARRVAREAVEIAASGGSDVIVKINTPWELAALDLEGCVWPGLAAIQVPDAEEPEGVARIDAKLGELEQERGLPVGATQLALTIESLKGLFAAQDLVRASGRVVSLTLGNAHSAREPHAEHTPEGDEILLPQLQIVLLARHGGVTPLGALLGGLASVSDLDLARRKARWARSVGFRGAACVTPEQVAIANEEFAPDAAAVDRARRVIAAYEEGLSRGDGWIAFEGGIVDTPVVTRATRLIARADRIAEIDARKASALEASAG
jgi:citrate lyase subunit beta/citryl-CoA lyase